MSIEGHLLKLTASTADLTVQPGKEVVLPVKIARSPRLTEPVKLELILPENLQGLLRMEPLTLPPGRTEAILRISTVNDPRLSGERSFTIRATAMQPGNLAIVSEAAVPFVAAK